MKQKQERIGKNRAIKHMSGQQDQIEIEEQFMLVARE
jgi:hypothetical protein